MVGENVMTTASFVAHIGQKHGSNILYDAFWDQGCVFFARTTQPQAIMHLETTSNIHGRTVNPYNRALTPGGSSGGESALLGMRGSILVRSLVLFCLLFIRIFADQTRVLVRILVVVFAVQLPT